MDFRDRIRLPTYNLIYRRLRLISTLTNLVEAGHCLIKICASGGYGKSVLLADFAQVADLSVCGCFLEPADRTPTSFLTLLTYSVTERLYKPRSQVFQSVQLSDRQIGVRRIVELLADVGPHLIILILNDLLAQLPPTSRPIIASRSKVNLPVPDGQAITLSKGELRRTPAELQGVMRKRFGYRLDFALATEIVRATKGNLAQILLVGHPMRDDGPNRAAQRLGDDQEMIYCYLAEEPYLQLVGLRRSFASCDVTAHRLPSECQRTVDI